VSQPPRIDEAEKIYIKRPHPDMERPANIGISMGLLQNHSLSILPSNAVTPFHLFRDTTCEMDGHAVGNGKQNLPADT
jgi:hypothetical protein